MFKKLLSKRAGRIFGIFLIVFIGLIIWRIPYVLEQRKAEETVAFIHAQKLTIENVDGNHLPPPPNPELVDATIEGIDANANYIRDDVELAIFKKYPNDIKIRAAELQYAMALQLYLTKVFDTTTWVAAARQNSRGAGCVFDTAPDVTIEDGEEVVRKVFALAKQRQDEVRQMVFNTEARINHNKNISNNYTTTYSSEDTKECDVAL